MKRESPPLRAGPISSSTASLSTRWEKASRTSAGASVARRSGLGATPACTRRARADLSTVHGFGRGPAKAHTGSVTPRRAATPESVHGLLLLLEAAPAAGDIEHKKHGGEHEQNNL